jgi:hemerythrin-like domain-containing protein
MNRESAHSPKARASAKGPARRRSAGRRAKAQPIPEVMQCLIDEHRHFKKLLDLMAHRARRRGKLGIGDYCLLHDVVSYLHDYPDQIHHPTEDRVFTRLLERDGTFASEVEALRSDHQNIGEETDRLLAQLANAIDEPNEASERNVREVCGAFAAHQLEHMKLENEELFPAAIERLGPEDWQDIEAYFATVDDPLFGKVVGKRHRFLYEYLVHPMEEATRKYTTSRVSSLERFARTTDALERGAGDIVDRLKIHRNVLAEESRVALLKSLRPESLKSALLLPMEYSALVGKTFVSCGVDVVRICAQTVGRANAIRREE